MQEQTVELCLATVESCGEALYYVKDQTPQICLTIVRENGNALEYVKKQSPELCRSALRETLEAAKFIQIHWKLGEEDTGLEDILEYVWKTRKTKEYKI